MRRLLTALSLIVLVAVAASAASAMKSTKNTTAHHAMAAPKYGASTTDNLQWGPVPPALPPGAELSVLEGNPFKPGPFTMRVKMPDGYRIPAHWHPGVEHVTVMSGTFHLGMGPKFDEKAGQAYAPGSFAWMAPHMKHYAWATGETVIQLHGTGPWGITYVNPADDPRGAKKPS